MTKIHLESIETRAPKNFIKEKTKIENAKLRNKLEALQNLLYAESKHALLIIIQGMDASGKDGAVKNVFGSVNPLGCRVIPFKKPSELELKHDFLWRIHQHVPEKGMITIFNRSHYEDVIIQKIHKWVDEETIIQRYEDINNFEKLLNDNSTTILKFYLHISKDEQLERLKERLSNPTKMWKYNENDIIERGFWDDYMNAYQTAFEQCSKVEPWHIIPSDQNWYKEFLILSKVVETLEKFDMKFPGLKSI